MEGRDQVPAAHPVAVRQEAERVGERLEFGPVRQVDRDPPRTDPAPARTSGHRGVLLTVPGKGACVVTRDGGTAVAERVGPRRPPGV
ncbi:hypothetical protein [Streptomyces sp. NPDC005760]|uniref:hypothetical protein n=1 Tax=Streptomyces sp. NPDC005760 TaxID=3156718 RepID=UPI0033E4073F